MKFIAMKPSLLGLLLALPCWLLSQNLEQHIINVQSDIKQLESQQKMLESRLEELKLQKVQRDLRDIGLPSQNYVLHTALALEYDEEHEQAKWVAHIITPDVRAVRDIRRCTGPSSHTCTGCGTGCGVG